MLSFQNRAPGIKLLIIHTNRDDLGYLEKRDLQWSLICQIWDSHWICDVETSPRVVSHLDFESQLALHAKQGTINLAFYRLSRKTWIFVNEYKYRHIIYRWKSFFTMINNSRSLAQNMVPFDSDQLSKFRKFAQKSMPPIRALSSRTEGTNTTRRLRVTD